MSAQPTGLTPQLEAALRPLAERAAHLAVAGIEPRIAELEDAVQALTATLAASRPGRVRPAPVSAQLRPQVLAALGDQPVATAALERAVGRHPRDRTVRRLLAELEEAGLAAREDGGWRRPTPGQCPVCRSVAL